MHDPMRMRIVLGSIVGCTQCASVNLNDTFSFIKAVNCIRLGMLSVSVQCTMYIILYCYCFQAEQCHQFHAYPYVMYQYSISYDLLTYVLMLT